MSAKIKKLLTIVSTIVSLIILEGTTVPTVVNYNKI